MNANRIDVFFLSVYIHVHPWPKLPFPTQPDSLIL